MCTDGFWEYVYEADMEKAIADGDDAGLILGELEKILFSRTPETNDNYTAALALFGGDDRFKAVSTDEPDDGEKTSDAQDGADRADGDNNETTEGNITIE